jgi:hypothetical protein
MVEIFFPNLPNKLIIGSGFLDSFIFDLRQFAWFRPICLVFGTIRPKNVPFSDGHPYVLGMGCNGLNQIGDNNHSSEIHSWDSYWSHRYGKIYPPFGPIYEFSIFYNL